MRRWYKKLALFIANILLLFVLINLIIGVWGWRVPSILSVDESLSQPKGLTVYQLGALGLGIDGLRKVYPDMKEHEIIQLLLESWNVPLACNPKTLYREQPFNTTYISVAPEGFRGSRSQKPPNSSDDVFNIFVFGGSTTFGYGEPDESTIPALLQQELQKSFKNVQVYNFGHSYFFSLQEKWELERLIEAGYVPDMAIFVDGLNDFYHWDGKPTYRPCSAIGFWQNLRNTIFCRDDQICLPIQKFARHIASRTSPKPTQVEEPTPPANDDTTTNTAIINRWLNNKKEIENLAAKYSISTVFVMQPVPTYRYDLKKHEFLKDDKDGKKLGRHVRAHWGYGIWEKMAAQNQGDWARNVLNLSNLGEKKNDPIYVDAVHYSKSFMRDIASSIANHIHSNHLINNKN